MRIGLPTILLALASCRPGETTPPEATTTVTLAESEGDESGSRGSPAADGHPECVSLVEAEVADDAYARDVAKLEFRRSSWC